MLNKFVNWLYHKVWEGRKNWSATCTYPLREQYPDSDVNRAFSGNNRLRWSTMRPQEVDVFYTLDISKQRKIVSVAFDSGVSLFHYPAKFELMTFNDKHQIVHIINADGPINCELKPNKPIRLINVKIIEVQKMENGNIWHWSIHDIKLKERRLFGLWNPIIK